MNKIEYVLGWDYSPGESEYFIINALHNDEKLKYFKWLKDCGEYRCIKACTIELKIIDHEQV